MTELERLILEQNKELEREKDLIYCRGGSIGFKLPKLFVHKSPIEREVIAQKDRHGKAVNKTWC